MLMIISSVISSLHLKTVLKTVLNIKTINIDYKYRSMEYNLLTRLIAKHVTKFKRSILLCMYMIKLLILN